MSDLKELLQSCPVLYPSTREGEGDVLVTQDDNYEYAVGVTLDFLPEERTWIASYSDFVESEPMLNPEDAVEDLQKKLRLRGLM